jgi:hypothetical protein
MKNIVYLKSIVWLFVFVTVLSCEEEPGPQPLENNTNPPGMVTNLTVVNLKGKARITYTLPSDKDLLYVKANYTLENGTEMEVKASYYQNTMLLEGFRGGQDVNVEIRAVNRSEVGSEPLNATVSPLLAPIFDVFDSLETTADFGGLRVRAENTEEDDVAILVMTKNPVDDWEPIQNSIYTSRPDINQAIRGFEAEPKDFALVVRDRWQNVTDTLFTEITPLFETIIPISGYSGLRLANDQESYPENRVEYMWDNQFGWPRVWLTFRGNSTQNHTVTVDMGTTAKLSRVRIWQYPENVGGTQTYYYLGSLRYFRIWGASETPDPSGVFDDKWVLLGEYENIKPSSLPYGDQSNEDILTAQAGEDYEIPLEAPPVRYIRIQNLENWGGAESLAVAEMYMYGDPNY